MTQPDYAVSRVEFQPYVGVLGIFEHAVIKYRAKTERQDPTTTVAWLRAIEFLCCSYPSHISRLQSLTGFDKDSTSEDILANALHKRVQALLKGNDQPLSGFLAENEHLLSTTGVILIPYGLGLIVVDGDFVRVVDQVNFGIFYPVWNADFTVRNFREGEAHFEYDDNKEAARERLERLFADAMERETKDDNDLYKSMDKLAPS
jgi:hypothetical protein